MPIMDRISSKILFSYWGARIWNYGFDNIESECVVGPFRDSPKLFLYYIIIYIYIYVCVCAYVCMYTYVSTWGMYVFMLYFAWRNFYWGT